MDCPNCTVEMTGMTLERRMSGSVDIDVCRPCHSFWFDKYESLQLSPASTLQLMKFIGEESRDALAIHGDSMGCPRCLQPLSFTHDLQGNTPFSYWRCPEHGRFIGFLDFLREKNFIRVLSRQEIVELRKNIQIINCSNCGAPINLGKDSACSHCTSPISMLDMKQPERLIEELRKAAEPKPIDPMLPFELARVSREVNRWFGPIDIDSDWTSEVASAGLVRAGLDKIVRWLKKVSV